MKLTVHIGTTKTGTTSIQRYIHQNRDELLEQGVFVPISLGTPIHLNAVLSSLPFGDSPDLARAIPIPDLRSYYHFREETCRNYEAELASLPSSTHVLISAEYLHSRVASHGSIQEFKRLFCHNFERVNILVYLRPQLDHIISLYSTLLREGKTQSINTFVRRRMRPQYRAYFNLQSVITRWVLEFGHSNVTVRPYKGVSHELGVLGDFCKLLNVNLNIDVAKGLSSENRSIPQDAQELLKTVSSHTSDRELLDKVCDWVDEYCEGSPSLPDPALAREFQSLFVETNRWVTRNYFPEHPEYLEPRHL